MKLISINDFARKIVLLPGATGKLFACHESGGSIGPASAKPSP